ncbi:MAG TPA: FAD-dependent oxidoreductase [Candidatus Acidoferrales bacterium]|jgi:3-phenylpropionate/trans-cinnamate dioxygenase ferredoxin reductase subunit|nr:FAD-dependent oxidoreductase [Candidatus Acidoferrales bacterium]
MPHYKYLIIGGGMTGDAAVHGIREIDPNGPIGIISQEPDNPYDRPPLTKGLWKDKPLESIWRHTENERVEFHLGRNVTAIESAQKRVTDDARNTYTYDKLLIATGGRPRQLPFGDGQIIYYRTLNDFRRLHELTDKNKRFVVIGSGFIGSEIAAALAMNHKEVAMVFPGKSISDRVFPQDLSEFLNGFYREKGVDLLPGESATGLAARNGELLLRTSNGRELVASAVVAGIGIQPNIELAQKAGLKTDNGVIVDEFLRTTQPDIYAAGDVAAFFSPALGKNIRVEHEDNANTMGKMAGHNMAGKTEAYRHLPFFYSDLFELGYEAVGDLDSRLETFADWKTPFREGVVYYLNQGRVRGVLLWNVWGQVDNARALINEPGPFKPDNLKGRLPK